MCDASILTGDLRYYVNATQNISHAVHASGPCAEQFDVLVIAARAAGDTFFVSDR